MKTKLVAILISIILISCSDTGIDGLKENGPKEINGKVFDVFKGDTLFNENVEATLDGNTFYTNSEGEFQITDIEVGDHQLTFNSEDHLYSDTAITVSDEDTKLLKIQLAQKLVDFFPLGENKEQEFLGETSSIYWGSPGTNSISTGSKTKFRSITSYISLPETESMIRYHIETINDGYVVNFESKDSVIQNSDTTYKSSRYVYLVNEDKDTAELTFDLVEGSATNFGMSGPYHGGKNVVYKLGRDYYYGEFRGRYIPKSRLLIENTLTIDGELYTVKADTGLTNYQYGYGGHTGKGSTELTLVSFKN